MTKLAQGTSESTSDNNKHYTVTEKHYTVTENYIISNHCKVMKNLHNNETTNATTVFKALVVDNVTATLSTTGGGVISQDSHTNDTLCVFFQKQTVHLSWIHCILLKVNECCQAA